jgi:sugar (pentulose or hexulose) kinase
VTPDTVLVLDAGTSALRALTVGAAGDVQELTREPWRMLVPDDAAPFGRELAEDDVRASLGRVLAAASSLRDAIAGVAITGQREGLTFIDERGDAAYLGPNVDARAAAEGFSVDSAHAAEVYEATGHLPSLLQAGAKLAWLRANRPDDAARVQHALPLADWLVMQMTGARAVSRSLGVENGLIDLYRGDAAKEILALFGAGSSIVPRIVAEGSLAGAVCDGPLAGVPVVHAGPDTQCALLGMQAVSPGDCGVVAGWSAPVQLVTDAPVLDAARRTWTGRHVVPGRSVVESNAGDTGRAWDWACALLGVSATEADTAAAGSAAGAGDVLAVVTPPAMDAAHMNAGLGAVTLPLPLAMSTPQRADVLRAMLEAIAFALRANVEQLEAVAGGTIDRIALGGGMARGETFSRVVCDVLGREVVVHGGDVTAVGAAAVAAPTLGLADSAAVASERLARARRTLTPKPRAAAAYDDVYERWRETAARLDELAGGRS